MMPFAEFLRERLQAGGFTTEDLLASTLPLVRQVAAAHRVGLVAPLQGINAILVENNCLFFEEARARKPVHAGARLRELEKPAAKALEIVGAYRMDLNVDQGSEKVVSLRIGQRGEPLTHPVYFPGYLSWEHEIGHHDPLTDIFVLGLILAACAGGFDLNDSDDLASLVQHRRNLFNVNPHLHPVLAKVITRMTELDRHRRPQDLFALLRTLENHRDQNVDFDIELARNPTFANADRQGKRARILSCLQQRLFEISRRNRLLHFRATNQFLNLTWASVPLSFDMQNVRPDQILTWGHAFQDAITAGGQLSLNKYLRFEEALYLPGQLDEIRNEARRDQTEYGVAQLRLVVCFLRWANLKENPPERFDSPLVFLPVRLNKTKGVRDVYTLESVGAEAEINPVLRHYLKQLYAVDLPEFIDLSRASLDDLHSHLAAKVQASEPAVTIEKIDKPRINLIHAKAQRRLEQYRRRIRLSGRGVRSFMNIDYSYERDNYHPLGLRLFQTRIAPAEPRLRTLVEETPRPRPYIIPPSAAQADTRERQLYSQVEEETNPFRWEFDLCNVTLGNFHYRKMSLVRDYSALLDKNEEHAGFDTIFSLEPRETLTEPSKPLPPEESYPIVNCDPTQASAIALARTGKHFIIQGPPGTGKSQTITNLIADFVARGQRVLFVCEKRAAIDVVYHRLRQAGLHELCCLIHDAQEDKKEFILDLKATYEAFLATKTDQAQRSESKRGQLIHRLRAELAPLERFDAAMRSTPAQAGTPMVQLLGRAVALAGKAPNLTPRQVELLPTFHFWHEHANAVERFCDHLQAVQSDGVLANHPLRRLHSRFGQIDRPLQVIQDTLPRVNDLVDKLLNELGPLNLPTACWDTLERLDQIAAHAESLLFLAEEDLLGVLVAKSELAKLLAQHRKKITNKTQELELAQAGTKAWRRKLSPPDTETALQQMRLREKSIGRFISPAWWRLRGILRRSYDFASHQIPPSYTHVLDLLKHEHQVAADLEKLEAEARDKFAFKGPFRDFAARVASLAEGVVGLAAASQTFHRQVLASSTGAEIVQTLAPLRQTIRRLQEELASFLAGAMGLSPRQIRDETTRVEQSLDEFPSFAPCLTHLAALPAPLAEAWRSFPFQADQLEAAIAKRTIEEILRGDPPVARFNGKVQTLHRTKLEQLHDQWHEIGANVVRERVCLRFLDHVRIASQSAAQLRAEVTVQTGTTGADGQTSLAEKKEFKQQFNRGRRELEHEFNKSMRFRSIRDLVAGDSGQVLRGLKPVWLMSPLSVSDALPLETIFDVVIFDEASQVTLEEAVPAIFRAKQVLVVGDEMQLPPTSFFSAKSAADEEDRLRLIDASGQEVEYDLGSNSFLNHAARNLPATMLGWHYRSRSESLISFSNAAFYQGRLLTVPEVALPPAFLSEIIVTTADEGYANHERLLERPVSFHFLEKGVYDQRRNAVEADYIAHLVRGLLAGQTGMSIGIIAFSEAQQGEIEQALLRLARTDEDFPRRLEAEWEREEDGQFVGLLVKNLENIQGDERDLILLSVCYGNGPNGKMLMNFGPINQSGGERRLNVAFSRAKKHMALVSSIRHYAITNDYNDGARALKNYLRYAEACSAGDSAAARRVLWEINPADRLATTAASDNVVVAQLTAHLRQRGYEVDADVGQSNFRCDLAVRRSGENQYRLGILVDTDNYYQNENPLERDVLRPRLLRTFGWDIVFVLTKDWFEHADAVLEEIERKLLATP